jgi:hypothetical protein
MGGQGERHQLNDPATPDRSDALGQYDLVSNRYTLPTLSTAFHAWQLPPDRPVHRAPVHQVVRDAHP